jgi:hypothetical protein
VAFIGEHLNKGIQPPIVKNSSIEMFVALLVLFHNHLSLRQISHHNSSLNQFVANQMTCFVERVTLLTALFLGDAPVNLAQVDVPFGLLLAFVAFRSDFIELTVVPSGAFEPAHVIDLAP